jgi:energy-coupling factor transport system permease protein
VLKLAILRYVDKKSFLHELDPRTKIALCGSIMIISLIFNHPLLMVSLFIFVLILSFVAKIHKEFLARIKALAGVVIFAFILWTLAYRLSLFTSSASSKVFFVLGPIAIDELSLLYGISMPFRILILIGAPLLFFMTTTFNELILSFVKLKIPYLWAFTIGLSLRLITSVLDEAKTIKDAQVSRGLELEKGSLLKRIKNYIPIISPLISKVMGMEDQLAISMETKAFGSHKKRTFYKELRMKRRDLILTFLSLLLLFFCVWLRSNNFGIIK